MPGVWQTHPVAEDAERAHRGQARAPAPDAARTRRATALIQHFTTVHDVVDTPSLRHRDSIKEELNDDDQGRGQWRPGAQGHDAEHAPDQGFERWRKRQAEKATKAPTTDDAVCERYVARATGADAADAASVVRPEAPGRGVVIFSEADMDDEAYKIHSGELDGSNARKRAEENARQ